MSQSSRFYFAKQPSEERTRAVDFSGAAEFQAGEVIESAIVDVTLRSDGAPVPGMLVSHAVDDGKQRVLFRIRGGEDKQTYKITVVVTTDKGHKIEADVVMMVREL